MRQGQGLQCSFDQALIDEEKLRATGKFLLPALTALRAATKKGYVDECSSINFPVDTKTVRAVKAFAAKHRAVDLLIVVGIGGANLGPLAVEEALLGKLHNETGKPRVYFADTVDTAKIHRLNVILAEALRRNQRVLLNVISSSGTTTETIANFAVLFATMQAYEENAVVVVTTKRSSPLWKLATREGFETFVVPETVGDRYAIMSPVGLFPLAVLGVDVEELLQGAAAMREKCLSMDVLENPAAVGAIIQYLHHKGGVISPSSFSSPPILSPSGSGGGSFLRRVVGRSMIVRGRNGSGRASRRPSRLVRPICIRWGSLILVGRRTSSPRSSRLARRM